MPRIRNKRSELLHYFNSGTESVPVWELIGAGISEMTESKNAQTEDVWDIDQEVGTTIHTGNRTALSYDLSMVDNDAFNDLITSIHFNDTVGATVTILSILKLKTGTSPYQAKKATYNVLPTDGLGGAGGASLGASGSLSQDGNAVFGTATFSGTTPTFTQAS